MLDCLDAFYGGAAGGGKSIALLTAALLYVHIPKYNAILIRDTMKNLGMPDSIMDVSHQWLTNTDAHWSGDHKRWVFPSGATVGFGYLDSPRDHFNYQSAQFQFAGIDEAVNIRENQAKYIFSRLRKLINSTVPIRFRCASNPPAGEQIARGQWVKDRYVDPVTRKKGTVFIPAKMEDNKHLDVDQYKISLAQLDPITRKQLEEGDWEIKPKGKLFAREWFELVDSVPIDAKRVRYWDLAATEPSKENKEPCYTVGAKLAIDKDNIIYIESIIRFRKDPKYVEQIIRQTADMDGKSVHIHMEQEPGSSGKNTIDHYRRRILPEFAFYPDKVSGNKLNRATPLSSQAQAGNVKIVKGYWNEEWFNEAELFPDGTFLDQIDATSGAFNVLFIPNNPRVRVI
jgi:predicted phage terminase large subunit-like protein